MSYLLSSKYREAGMMHLILLIKLKCVQITPQFVPLCLTRLAKGNFIPKTWFSLQGAKIKKSV